MESVLWGKYATPDETIALGEEMVAQSRATKLLKNPDLPINMLPVYAGFMEGEVGLIRAKEFVGVPTIPGERRCVPDVYDVVHLPENGVKAHAHIVLLDGYIEAIKSQMRVDGSAGVDLMTRKLAYPAAIGMLVSTMEAAGFFCHNGDHIPCQVAA